MSLHRKMIIVVSVLVLQSIAALSVSYGQSPSNPVETLKTCVLERLPAERGKANPSFDSVKNSCAQEYDALLAAVHPKVADEYKKLIRKDIENELKKEN